MKQNTENQKPLGVLIVGYGLSGRIFHGALLTSMPDYFCIKGIVTSNAQKAEQALHDLPGVVVYSQEAYSEALENDEIDLAIISTPNTTHAPLAIQALEAGKHVLIEKPFVPTVEEGKQIQEAAKKASCFVSIYHNRRFDGDFLTLQRVLSSGKLGRIVAFESRFDRFRPEPKTGSWREMPQPGSGILFDLGSHLIDQASVLFGRPSKVHADIRKQRGNGAQPDDGFELILDYPEGSKGDGIKVSLMSGSFVNYPTPRFALLGDKGSYVQYGLDPQESDLREGKRPHLTEAEGSIWGERAPGSYGKLYNANGEIEEIHTIPGDYRIFFKQFYRSLVEKDESLLPVSMNEALDTIEIILEACQIE